MPLWLCDFEKCSNPAVQREGCCLCCDKHLCSKHLSKSFHNCPNPEENWSSFSAQYAATEDRHIDELCHRIDNSNLCSRASELRDGIQCTVNLSRKHLSSMMGHQNCHAEIIFEDGVSWLARFRLARTTSPPEQVRDFIFRSEAGTLTYLHDRTSIPVPRIFDWACASDPDNQIGVSYILMEKLDGMPLVWQAANPAQREKVMQQLVDVFLEIERHPFEALGSLITVSDSTSFVVQGIAQHATYTIGPEGPLGPFTSSLEGSINMIKSYLTMIASGEISAYHSVDTYLTHRFRLDIANKLWGDESAGGRFFLKHPDDKGDHILVNESYDIVGIIDWEWTRTASKVEAFTSPCMMWPLGKFYEGSNELAPDEKRLAEIFQERSREDLSKCVLLGRQVQRFFFALGPESPSDRRTLLDLFEGLKAAFNFEGETWEGWEKWKGKALRKWKNDELLQGLLRLQVDEEDQ
ncbi:hypothetical protein CORC01_10776 [Colletotrichum orchidophilum]|uniref:Aminoglycoside phosphotransferase domain-containing protein n=1 Tax=Colletotrichum orchidophilum TaxID=1209926 RepID=A0A1G4AXL5_9PEZI|nr:uncharacterized protein CORC01_10776 [Colletotrichum orchidophilum]OHE93877.1 hypothetical protein CORC01_10776 [Colletotrichum orchidophilum]